VSVLSPHPGWAQPSVRLVSGDARCQHHGSMQSTLAEGMTRREMTQRDGLRAGVATVALARDSDAHALSRQLRTLAPAAPSIEHRAAVRPLQWAKYIFPHIGANENGRTRNLTRDSSHAPARRHTYHLSALSPTFAIDSARPHDPSCPFLPPSLEVPCTDINFKIPVAESHESGTRMTRRGASVKQGHLNVLRLSRNVAFAK
jgi:hypothetical protein